MTKYNIKWLLTSPVQTRNSAIAEGLRNASCQLKSCQLPRNTHTFNGPLSGTTRVGQYQKGKTKLDFTEARDSEWQWHQLGHMQVCTWLQTDNHTSTPLLTFFYRPDALPAAQPTASKYRRHCRTIGHDWLIIINQSCLNYNLFSVVNCLNFPVLSKQYVCIFIRMVFLSGPEGGNC